MTTPSDENRAWKNVIRLPLQEDVIRKFGARTLLRISRTWQSPSHLWATYPTPRSAEIP